MTCSAARNGASSSTYMTARAKNDATSDSAPTTGLRCRITTSAKMIAMAAKKKKMASSIMRQLRCRTAGSGQRAASRPTRPCPLLAARCSLRSSNPPLRDEPRHEHNIHHRQRQEHLPADLHQDVVLDPWDRPAHPDEDEQDEADLGEEGDGRQQEAEQRGRLVVPRDVPPSEEERDDERRHRGHGDVLGHEEH